MKFLFVVVVLFSVAEAFIGGGLGGFGMGMRGPMCCCTCMMPVPVPMPAPVPVPMIARTPMIPRRIMPCCCPCPVAVPVVQQQQQCCCSVVSPVQIQSLATTAAPIGVPDIIRGPCGETIVPLFNPPLANQVTGK